MGVRALPSPPLSPLPLPAVLLPSRLLSAFELIVDSAGDSEAAECAGVLVISLAVACAGNVMVIGDEALSFCCCSAAAVANPCVGLMRKPGSGLMLAKSGQSSCVESLRLRDKDKCTGVVGNDERLCCGGNAWLVPTN